MPVLGMQGSGTFSADERPRNWRQGINFAFPNGDTPLTAILSMLPEEKTDDPEFRWFEKGLPEQRAIVLGAKTSDPPSAGDDIASGAQADNAIAYLLVADETIFNPGHVIRNLTTDEILLVISTSSANHTIAVRRDHGAAFGTNPALTGDTAGDPILIVGNGSPEGADAKDAILYQPYRHFNYTQIFRNSLEFTRTGLRTRLRYDKEGPYLEAQREAYQLHAMEIEKALLLSERAEVTTIASGAGNLTGVTSGKPLRTTRGIASWLPAITTSASTATVHWDIGTAFSGLLTEDAFDNWCEELFRYGSSEKLALCGGTFLNALNKLAKNKFTIEAVPTDETYGLKLTRYKTTFGDLLLKQHPLLSHDPVMRKDCYAIDVSFLKLRVLDDTEFKENVQGNGIDGMKDEFITELGLQVDFSGATPSTAGGLSGTAGPAAHGKLKGVTGFGG